ncbi:cell division protein FtsA [Candidatus Uhrbacteria bacterium CG_4_10_14_0_8_um_filter_58_22]|uniref:Cell division protein FtsA n=1 Tax=Candidatus Uhrbacteria bacterium CG_4_10_14_0_8_um_filter_58_22 TaxID=1975029 RepID=A0A2M7QBE5_9BACT|nr:MAG: cell division protein FtsA [Candidatus Uhrbacteria bacterium CG_4_10_14_0_8_um_filter_58_22]
MADDSLFAGIDIGSTAVRIAVGQKMPNADRGQVHIIGAAETVSEGINRGIINSIEDAVSSVSACIEKVERMTGMPFGSAWVSVSGPHVSMLESRGVVAVSRPDGEIRDKDVERAVDAAQTVATPVNYEIIHVIPKSFAVDGQTDVRDPVGMSGIRLEVNTQIIQGLSSHIRNLTKCVYRTGVNIEKLVLGALAASEVVVTSRQKELGVAVVNIGGASTNLAVFEHGDLLHIGMIPLGSDHVTADIAIGLRTSIDTAERVKLQHASATPKSFGKGDLIDLKEMGVQDSEEISLRYVSQIVEARCEELLEKVDKELKTVGRSGLLPAGVVLTGGGAKLPGLVELAKEKLRLPVSLGFPVGMTSITDRVNDLSFSTAIGLVQWGINDLPPETRRGGLLSRYRPMDLMSKGIRKLFGQTS